ncbi:MULTISPECIES: hypothetical protein [Pseudomonas]|nr:MULTISPECIES: hypothetical protein [Pseudomonas]BBP62703.1 hypothetical protein PHLH5_02440 [Pseudomonas sp. Cab53]
MSYKLALPTTLILCLLLGGCMEIPEEPPILAIETPVAGPATS